MRFSGITLFLFCYFGTLALAQDTLQQGRIFNCTDFLFKVVAHHPLARQAQLLTERARMEIRVARGGFDPSLNYYLSEKQYSGTGYYLNRGGFLKIPGWPGPEIKAGFEQNSGVYLNPADRTPAEGLLYGGFSIPIGQGLITDQRRIALRQAQVGKELAEADLIKAINKLLLESVKDYWLWMEAWYKADVLKEGLTLARQRNEAIQQGVIFGQFSGLDSVESGLEVVRREAALREAEVFQENMRLILSTYLWDEEGNPLELAPSMRPDDPFRLPSVPLRDSLAVLIQYAEDRHPELLSLRLKTRQLKLEKSLMVENLKPVINLEYFPILTMNAQNPGGPSPYFRNNYKFGLDVYFPLFLRKERGKLSLTKIKIEQMELQTDFEAQRIRNQVLQKFNEFSAGAGILDLQATGVRMSEKLRDGEEERFRNGESSFFLVNTRERSLLDTRLKWVEVAGKFQKLSAELRWSAGLPPVAP
jgi:outer membrane protein TolC